jgi:signal peptidase II
MLDWIATPTQSATTNMNLRKIIHYALLLAVVTANIGCDQISKSVARAHLDYHERVSVLGEHVVLTKVENTGAFLSLGDDLPPTAKMLLLNLLPTLALLGMLFWLLRSNVDRATAFGLCCVLGGGIGNLVDRLAYGSVTDFLYLEWGRVHTGIFNLADVSITGGVLFIVALQIWNSWKVRIVKS